MKNKTNKLARISFYMPIALIGILLIFFDLRQLSLMLLSMSLTAILFTFPSTILGIIAFRKIRKTGESGIYYVYTGWLMSIPILFMSIYFVLIISGPAH